MLNNVIFSTVVPLQSIIDTRNTQILPHRKETSIIQHRIGGLV